MPQIMQLDAHVAELIAAGEVVERPASVVKELVENAIDAGASAVAVEIQNGGMRLIRVTDNGCGIAPEQLPTAFLRHATSKLRTAEDLARIGTLGFRGEALSAIAAVSRVEIETRQPARVEGAALSLEGGVPGAVEAAGVPEGTTIRVRDLFYNTPARLKFMKKDSAESAAVGGLLQHLALSHPDVSFKLIKDGEETLHTPGDGKLLSAIYAALGRDFAKTLLPVEGRGGEIAAAGFVTRPLNGRGSRGMQVFFVNGRFIKSQLLTAALEEAYRNQLLKGKFPGCVLSVTLPVTAVDVNVHPAKTQVKFAREREVFDAVYHTVLDALNADGGAAELPGARRPEQTVNPRGDFFQSMDAKAYRERSPRGESRTGAVSGGPDRGWDTEWKQSARVADSGRAAPFYQTKNTFPQEREGVLNRRSDAGAGGFSAGDDPAPPVSGQSGQPARRSSGGQSAFAPSPAPAKSPLPPAIPAMGREPMPPPQETLLPAGEAPWRIAGEVLRTYIICESEGGDVYLIDKHAAHERINFDRLQSASEPPASQQLLSPAAVQLPGEDASALLEHLPMLERLGFACEDFGGGTVLVRAVPADLDAADVSATLEELAEALRAGRSPDEKREDLLHTMACKAAVKAGMRSDERELRTLADRVQSGEIKYCPHGRPVAVKITKYQLEKLFKRA